MPGRGGSLQGEAGEANKEDASSGPRTRGRVIWDSVEELDVLTPSLCLLRSSLAGGTLPPTAIWQGRETHWPQARGGAGQPPGWAVISAGGNRSCVAATWCGVPLSDPSPVTGLAVPPTQGCCSPASPRGATTCCLTFPPGSDGPASPGWVCVGGGGNWKGMQGLMSGCKALEPASQSPQPPSPHYQPSSAKPHKRQDERAREGQ